MNVYKNLIGKEPLEADENDVIKIILTEEFGPNGYSTWDREMCRQELQNNLVFHGWTLKR